MGIFDKIEKEAREAAAKEEALKQAAEAQSAPAEAAPTPDAPSPAPEAAAPAPPAPEAPHKPAPAPPKHVQEHPKPAPKKQRVYTVKSGDSLSAIGERFGVSWQKIYAANKGKIKDPDLIYPGQEFVIPED